MNEKERKKERKIISVKKTYQLENRWAERNKFINKKNRQKGKPFFS